MSTATTARLRVFLAALVAVYCAKQVLTAVLFPPFTGHDEVAHYEYVRIVAREGRLPTLSTDTLPGRFFPQYKNYALQWRQLGQWTTPLYTAVHPPLYYLLMTPVYNATQNLTPVGKQYVLRFAAIPFGLLTVLLAYRLARTVFPGDEFLAVTVPVVVAFQPQVSYVAAMVNNDIVAVALFTWLLYLLVLLVRDGLSWRRSALVGCALGLGLLAKTTTMTALPLVLAAFWMARRDATWKQTVSALALAGGVTLMLVAPWYAFMYATYGNFSGLPQLAGIQKGLTRSDLSFLQLLFSGDFAMERWKETWGEFGWRRIPAPGYVISTTALLAIACAIGLAAWALAAWTAARGSEAAPVERWKRNALILLGAACVISYAAVLQFGTMFQLTQARYYFPAAGAAALLAMLGLRTLLPDAARGAAQMIVVLGSLAMNVIVYTTNVVPYWYFRH